jgi:hypothetical protein
VVPWDLNHPDQYFVPVKKNLSSSERNPLEGNDLPHIDMQPLDIPVNHNL